MREEQRPAALDDGPSDEAPLGGPSEGSTAPTSTRERILDIAQTLFADQGYDKTSLRDIADRLGTTKAALYYHFERKQDILMELHLRLHALGSEALGRLARIESGRDRADAWPALIDHLIDQVVQNRELVLMHQRNWTAFTELADTERHRAENDDFEELVRRVIQSPSIPLEQRVRMVCSLGAILGTLASGNTLFPDTPLPELAEFVRKAVHELLRA